MTILLAVLVLFAAPMLIAHAGELAAALRALFGFRE
jgi:hypothetical protein